MCHLVLARRNLLHHEECKTNEAETVAEVFENDTATDEPETARLIDSEQCVSNERKVEHAAEREERLLQAAVCNVVACKHTADNEGCCAEGAVAQADFLLCESETAACNVGFKEQRHNLHHEALCKTIEDDEEYIIKNVFFAEEIDEHIAQVDHCLLEVGLFGCVLCLFRRHEFSVVQTEHNHYRANHCHDYSPSNYCSVVLCSSCGCSAESGEVARVVVDEHTGKVNQSAGSGNLCDVIERTLPADVASLVVLRQRSHVNAVGSYVVCSAAEGDDSEQRNA